MQVCALAVFSSWSKHFPSSYIHITSYKEGILNPDDFHSFRINLIRRYESIGQQLVVYG